MASVREIWAKRWLVVFGLCVALAGATFAVARGVHAAQTLPVGEVLFTRGMTGGTADSPSAGGDLYAVEPDGSHLRLFIRDAADAAVSRDGSRIAFVRHYAIWIMQRDGSKQRQVTRPRPGAQPEARHVGSTDDAPAWSRDGKTLVFSRTNWKTVTAALFSIRSNGTGQRQLTRPRTQTGHFGDEGDCDDKPSVSLNGTLIVYTLWSSCHYGSATIRAVTTAGKTARLVVRMPLPSDFDPSFYDAACSPARSEIAYAVGQYNPDVSAIYVSGLNGERPRRVARTPSASGGFGTGGPAWSADGNLLMFARDGHIWLVRRDGTGLRKLTDAKSEDDAPAWLPRR